MLCCGLTHRQSRTRCFMYTCCCSMSAGRSFRVWLGGKAASSTGTALLQLAQSLFYIFSFSLLSVPLLCFASTPLKGAMKDEMHVTMDFHHWQMFSSITVGDTADGNHRLGGALAHLILGGSRLSLFFFFFFLHPFYC